MYGSGKDDGHKTWFHTDRAARGDRDHLAAGEPVRAGAGSCQGVPTEYSVRLDTTALTILGKGGSSS